MLAVDTIELNRLTQSLNKDYGALPSLELLDIMINNIFKDKIALVSSFGTEAALLLSLVSKVNKNTPVVFLDTGMHFPETLEYRDSLIERLGLTDVRSVKPEPASVQAIDPENNLWKSDTDKCCYIRKVLPLAEALSGFDAWINGRKRIHGGLRSELPTLENDGKHIKVNAIADWNREMIDAHWEKENLPEHPLVQWGYTSVGCKPELCTQKAAPGEGGRSGRWANMGKTECGIHSLGKTETDTSGGGI